MGLLDDVSHHLQLAIRRNRDINDRDAVIDIAVPPDCQLEVVRNVVQQTHVRGILAQNRWRAVMRKQNRSSIFVATRV